MFDEMCVEWLLVKYVQSGYWSAKKHEVYGVVQNPEGRTVHRLYGKWNEGLYYGDPQTAKCVWRPGEPITRAVFTNYDYNYHCRRYCNYFCQAGMFLSCFVGLSVKMNLHKTVDYRNLFLLSLTSQTCHAQKQWH